MGKSDDSIRRRKNKSSRKKQNESLKVSSRVASIIAAKKRRKTGKRSMCQGMCYSLPTPEDPFNDISANVEVKKKETKKLRPFKSDRRKSTNRNSVASKRETTDKSTNRNSVSSKRETTGKVQGKENNTNLMKTKTQHGASGTLDVKDGSSFELQDCPSKFLVLCLNSIQNALLHDRAFITEEEPFFVDAWGVDFWEHYSIGEDILETSGTCCTTEQIAWITSAAADTIARKEKEGLSVPIPFLLFLVSSKEKASMVRSVCKPLKALGIHTVSLHPGASLEHQIHGLRSCEPEFLVSTPERLLELMSSKAVDISGVSVLVIDELETHSKGGQTDAIKSIRRHISGNPHTLVFSDCLSCVSISLVQNLLLRSICRLSQNDSLTSRSACVIQSVHVCDSEEEKLAKGLKVLEQIFGNARSSGPIKVLFVIGESKDSLELLIAIKLKGYPISTIAKKAETESSSETGLAFFVVDGKHIGTTDLSEFEVVILSTFAESMDEYIYILTKMARFTVNGILHSFLTKEQASLSPRLIEILEQCSQAVPEALRNLRETTCAVF